MTKLEKVIKGLKCCSAGYNIESECPYFAECRCIESLRKDALELLKEQEPRVLTLEGAFEYQKSTPYVACLFVEIKNRADIFTGIISDDLYGDYHSDEFQVHRPWNGADRKYPKTEYGKTIRVWNLYPTEEQRKAVQWDE